MTETATVVDATDGDTVDVRFDDGREETVRIIGIDTPETGDNADAERRAEWEGIEELSYLGRWGDRASEFAAEALGGRTVDLVTDPHEPDRGTYGRLLRYVRYDPEGGEDRSAVYNRRAVAEGYARVYDSGFARHDDYLAAESAARAERRGVWRRSDPASTPEIRDRPIDRLFFPSAASVHVRDGPLPSDRAPVAAAETASQRLDAGTEYEEPIPLVGVDRDARVALVGAPLVAERFEEAEGFPVDTSRYGNLPFVTNLLATLSEREGPIVVDGGHGQFGADYALSVEDMAYYLRFLEGQDTVLTQRNSYADEGKAGSTDGAAELTELDDARALIVTAPAEPFSDAELRAVRSVADDGGCVLLLGHGTEGMPADARDRLNAVADALGTDLRLNGDRVVDGTSNLNDDPSIPVTAAFDRSFDLFDPVTPDPGGEPQPPLRIVEVVAEGGRGGDEGDRDDEHGDDAGADAGAGERVVFENASDGPLDLTGWTVEDEVGKTFAFPDGLVVPAGARLRLHTGEGTDRVDLYWGRSDAVWNDDGDTVAVYDDCGDPVAERSYRR